jgi:hypothetical protein
MLLDMKSQRILIFTMTHFAHLNVIPVETYFVSIVSGIQTQPKRSVRTVGKSIRSVWAAIAIVLASFVPNENVLELKKFSKPLSTRFLKKSCPSRDQTFRVFFLFWKKKLFCFFFPNHYFLF